MFTKTHKVKKMIVVILLGIMIVIGGLGPVRAIAIANDPSGALDVTFDDDGLATISNGSYINSNAIAFQSDGRIVLGGYYAFNGYGDFAMVRLNEDGSLDTAFDTDGKVVTGMGSFSEDVVTDIAIQPDGKIILTGYSFGVSFYRTFSLVRYNSNGSLDTTFDTDGKVTTDIGSYSDSGHAIALQPDGKILVVGYTGNTGNGTDNDIALVRYNTDGSLDGSFGTGGVVRTDIGNEIGFDVAVLPDGKIIVGGRIISNGSTYLALVRYNSNGSLDINFDGDGIVTTRINLGEVHDGDIFIQNEKIILAGYGNIFSTIHLIRYRNDGSLDTSFDGDGVLSEDLTAYSGSFFGIGVQSNGKIFVAGTGKVNSDSDFMLINFNSDGSLDLSYDADGISFTDFGAGQNEYGKAIGIQPDGKIVVAGARMATADVSEMAVARYLSGDVMVLPTKTPTITSTPFPYIIPTSVPPRPQPFLQSDALPPSSLTIQFGTTSGSPSSLSLLDQTGAEDNPAAYVSYQTPNGVYAGYQSFVLPADVQTRLISTALLQVNFKGPSSSTQTWTWSIYDWDKDLWIKLGNNIGIPADQWEILLFRIPNPQRYVSPKGEIRIQLRSNNSNGDAKIDYQALHITYLSIPEAPTLVTPGVPTK